MSGGAVSENDQDETAIAEEITAPAENTRTEQEQLDSIMRGEDSILATQKPTAENTLDNFPGLNNQG